ncbi:methyltransferase domain-containing protein [Marinitenerispora sediminis]|uniref:Class I SAM-dependent methyltransferase n=1 Tax=Marinitenerispora sediminis TaxID=1931232 RepID=A0A368T6L1_9ACTN|nr:class I SAM-dependent methyltransferase [Marinitenerispora sediminis]RCV53460.1 hypothetical protein DEF23_17425 [Marinitenerispora sediminis]RCV59288.1 hypothetical protein DEF24_09965 [Marinitenerispora sediminis]
MPTSDAEGKPWARARIVAANPKVVVDVGAGDGTYSRLARADTDARWVAVEAWGPYVTQYSLGELYDEVVLGDIRHIDLDTVAHEPDLVIVGDMLEHLPADEVPVLVRRLQGWARRLLVSVPVLHLEQGAVGGNWFERHLSEWSFEAMLDVLGAGVTESICGDVLAYYLWERS